MTTLTKRQKAFTATEVGKAYPAKDAIDLVKSNATAKFPEAIDIAVMLGVDPRKSDQAVRGATVLPHGTGKSVRVAVFADGDQVDAAKAAGADRVGMDDLAEEFKKGQIDYDVIIAMPSAMRVVGQLGQILGPRGLMPNPKVGTVSADTATAVKNAKAGQVRYRTDKKGIIHCTVGKAAFESDALLDNVRALLVDLKKLKPSSAKGVYFKKLVLSSTMGPSVLADISSIEL